MKKGWKREHRLVVHPDYQGIGIGTKFQKAVAEVVYKDGFVAICTTTTPALVKAMRRDADWVLYRYGRVKTSIAKMGGSATEHLDKAKSNERITYSFCYKGRKKQVQSNL
jgi:GNAT superfamily N-acetyltransferase